MIGFEGKVALAGIVAILCGPTVMPLLVEPAASAPIVAAEPGTAVVTLDRREYHRDADGLFRIHARIDGQRVRMVVDTGATVMVLTRADARRAGLATAGNARIRTVSGDARMEWARVDRLLVAGQTLRHIEVAVVDQHRSESLLGQNVLAQLGPITIDGDRLSIG